MAWVPAGWLRGESPARMPSVLSTRRRMLQGSPGVGGTSQGRSVTFYRSGTSRTPQAQAPRSTTPRQNHRVPAWQVLEGPSVGHPVQPPAEAGSPRAGCTAPHPGGSGISPEKETPQPPRAAWARAPSSSEGSSSSSRPRCSGQLHSRYLNSTYFFLFFFWYFLVQLP